MIEGLLPLPELHQDVDIACRRGFVSYHGSEDADTSHAVVLPDDLQVLPDQDKGGSSLLLGGTSSTYTHRHLLAPASSRDGSPGPLPRNSGISGGIQARDKEIIRRSPQYLVRSDPGESPPRTATSGGQNHHRWPFNREFWSLICLCWEGRTPWVLQSSGTSGMSSISAPQPPGQE